MRQQILVQEEVFPFQQVSSAFQDQAFRAFIQGNGISIGQESKSCPLFST
jgi:hypothetical protein